MDDFVFRLAESAKRKVFSPLEPLSLAEVLRECFSDDYLEKFWAKLGEGERPGIPRGTDTEVRIAVDRLLGDASYRELVQFAVADLRAGDERSQEVKRWLLKKKKK